MYPETAFREVRTSGVVADRLAALGLDVRTKVGRTGVVGLLRCGGANRTIALRADMDALPLEEANETPYRSRNRGVMHACGHDAHTAMLIGAAVILTRLRRELRGNVKFLFQPAEEITSGARAMLKAGAFRAPVVNAIVGLHVQPDLRFGSVGVRVGPSMARSEHFRIRIEGRGSHGARPHTAIDPLMAAHNVYQSLQTIRRNVDSFEPYVLSICSFHGGTTYNIIPGSVEMRGTLRTFKGDVRNRIRARIRKLLKGISEAFGVRCGISYDMASPPVDNDPAMVDMVRAAAGDLGVPVTTIEKSMGGEDFSYFLREAPGALFRLGTRKGGTIRGLHTDRFDIDEAVLPVGAAMMAQCAVRYLRRKRVRKPSGRTTKRRET